MPARRDLALQAIAGRTRLVAEYQFAVSTGQLADETPDRLWRVVDLAEEADLALTAFLGQSDRDLQLGGIQTDKHFAFLRHGSSLCGRRGAGPSGTTLARRIVGGRATSASNEHTVCPVRGWRDAV